MAASNTGMGLALRRRLDRAGIQNHRRGLAVPARSQAQEQPQVVRHASKQPARSQR